MAFLKSFNSDIARYGLKISLNIQFFAQITTVDAVTPTTSPKNINKAKFSKGSYEFDVVRFPV